VTRKISRAVAKIHVGEMESFELGNLDSVRDWGHARDYVEAMWLMLQVDTPDDFVISTGMVHTVKEFVEASFAVIGRKIRWEGKAEKEVGIEEGSNVIRVRVNAKYYRPTEVEYLQGDCTKAKEKLGWVASTPFSELVKEMVESDIALMKRNPSA